MMEIKNYLKISRSRICRIKNYMDFQQEPRLRRLPTRTFLSRLGVDFAKVPDHARVIA